jgi:phosphoserine aminotransferase
MSRVFNFSAGPAALPLEVLETIKNDLPDWQGSGMSVMEVSHRSAEFVELAARSEANLRELLAVPDDYSVLFTQGGATMQMAMAPLNLGNEKSVADYVITGSWGKKAANEARKFLNVNVAADASGDNFTLIPDEASWQRSNDAAYLHYTPNETIAGVEFHFVPGGDTPLVADMSSTILSRPIDVSRFGVIYAGAQKNIGPAGITLAIPAARAEAVWTKPPWAASGSPGNSQSRNAAVTTTVANNCQATTRYGTRSRLRSRTARFGGAT